MNTYYKWMQLNSGGKLVETFTESAGPGEKIGDIQFTSPKAAIEFFTDTGDEEELKDLVKIGWRVAKITEEVMDLPLADLAGECVREFENDPLYRLVSDAAEAAEEIGENELEECISSGEHLKLCDRDGYCQRCGRQF